MQNGMRTKGRSGGEGTHKEQAEDLVPIDETKMEL